MGFRFQVSIDQNITEKVSMSFNNDFRKNADEVSNDSVINVMNFDNTTEEASSSREENCNDIQVIDPFNQEIQNLHKIS